MRLPSSTRDGLEPFSAFFERWLQEQERDLQDLIRAAKSYSESNQSLAELVNRVMDHYSNYYRVKSESSKQNACQMLTPAWRSHLEDAFLWIGGWRPSMAFHLLYSKSGLQLEAGLAVLLSGLSTGDLGDLSASQLARVDDLHRYTVKEEKELTEKMAAHQETVADSSMVQLSHVVTELMHDGDSGNGIESVDQQVNSALGSKEDGLEEILGKADDLRLKTLKKVVDILSPIQAIHFLIAAAELHLRVHEWGRKKDAQTRSP
uniref:DOG1 domain-containing protein n=1 Tax=Opuntia streptacantha TaxID=393608 RepID=A0A7C9EWE0_OPUST